LNVNNTAGQRNPDRYIEDKFDKVWLPIDIFLDEKKSDKTDLIVRDQNIFKREAISTVFEKSPAIKAWTNMFLYRVVDYLQNNQKKIEIGMTTDDVKKALEDKSKPKIESRICQLATKLCRIYLQYTCQDFFVQQCCLHSIFSQKNLEYRMYFSKLRISKYLF